jgi:hypothetical protein
MRDIVDQTLAEWRAGKAVYGHSDCMLSIGRYLAATGHRDVTGQFIGRYNSHAGAAAMMDAHGGVAGLVTMTGAVAKEGPPCRGDIVEVLFDDDDGVTRGIGGICTGDSVALRRERGVSEVRLRMVQIGGVWHGSR